MNHLQIVFKSKEIEKSWIAKAEPKDVFIGQDKKQIPIDYKQFFIQKIQTDKHIDPLLLPRLTSYLNHGKTVFVEADDPFNQIQNLAIRLCLEMIPVEDFVNEVKNLDGIPYIFINDLEALTPNKGSGTFQIMETDDRCDLLLIGTEIHGSCQSVQSSVTNKTLVSYLMDGEIKAIAVKKHDKLVARALIRLMWDSKKEIPVILLERVYSNVDKEVIVAAIKEWAIEKANTMGLSLVSKEVCTDDEPSYQGQIKHFGGYAPYTYSDAVGGCIEGPFEVKDCKILYYNI